MLSQQQSLIQEKNEELQAINEELQSLNEELYANREELLQQKEKLERALAELRDSQDRMIQSEKMSSLGMLTAGIAHELKNPLNYISTGIYALENILKTLPGQITGILKGNKTEQQLQSERLNGSLESLGTVRSAILEGVTRSAKIIESLNVYTYTGESPMIRLDVGSCIEKALIILAHTFRDRITIRRDVDPGACIMAPEVKMVQMLTNVLSNAIDAIEDKGFIDVSVKQLEERVVIGIRDSGRGIEPVNLSHLFDPFFTTKEVGKGTGLGLSIVYTFVKQFGGEVNVESTPGEYTLFRFSFPKAPDSFTN
jgi:signal transduction histidine kinase